MTDRIVDLYARDGGFVSAVLADWTSPEPDGSPYALRLDREGAAVGEAISLAPSVIPYGSFSDFRGIAATSDGFTALWNVRDRDTGRWIIQARAVCNE
jgi:hypothetical protein